MTQSIHTSAHPIDADMVRRMCGDILDCKVAAVVATGASAADLETALAWGCGHADGSGAERRPLTGMAGEIYDILTADAALFEEE